MTRRTRVVCMLTAGLALGTGNLRAQATVDLAIGGGITIPTGSTSNGLNNGWHGTVFVDAFPDAGPFGLRLESGFQRLGFEGGDGRIRIIDATIDLLYQLAPDADRGVHPYLVLGGGVYGFKASSSFGSSPAETKFGVNAGGGVEFKASRTSLFVEGRFHNVFVPGSDFHFVPVSAGVRLRV